MLNEAMKNRTYSPSQLLNANEITVMGIGRKTSIGSGLSSLNDLADTPQEFDGNCDGIDALCYCLDRYTVEKTIDNLKKVLQRWEDMK